MQLPAVLGSSVLDGRMRRILVSFVFASTALVATTPSSSASAQPYPLEPEAGLTGPWKILLGVALGVADYAASGVGFERLEAGRTMAHVPRERGTNLLRIPVGPSINPEG